MLNLREGAAILCLQRVYEVGGDQNIVFDDILLEDIPYRGIQ